MGLKTSKTAGRPGPAPSHSVVKSTESSVTPIGNESRVNGKSASSRRRRTAEAKTKSGSGGNGTLRPNGCIERSKFVVARENALTSQYKLDVHTLGQGTYGSVVRGVNMSTGQTRAIKSITKEKMRSVERFRQEVDIMKSLDHPNIIKLFETYEDHRNIYLVMELCEGGELFDRIIEEGHFTEKHAGLLMKQIFSAVFYLHSHGVMHRDLKPENFMFRNRTQDSPLKIIDFGLSKRFKLGDVSSTKAGTPYYVAPEVLGGSYDKACDDWSCGVITYILLCGYPPFYGDTDAQVLQRVKTGLSPGAFKGAEWRNVSEDAKDLIRRLLQMAPKDRLTAEQALRHPWIRNLAKTAEEVALPSTLMSNLKGFRAQNRLKKAALTIIAQHITDRDIENLKNIFTALDTDHSGSLSLQEISEGLRRLGWTEIPPDLKQIIAEVDSDGSGAIDYTEFIAATMDRKLYMKEDVCWAAFRVFDLDGNGRISPEELKKVLGMPDVSWQFGKDTIRRLLEDVDLNGDGEIDFDEFMAMMKKKPPAFVDGSCDPTLTLGREGGPTSVEFEEVDFTKQL